MPMVSQVTKQGAQPETVGAGGVVGVRWVELAVSSLLGEQIYGFGKNRNAIKYLNDEELN